MAWGRGKSGLGGGGAHGSIPHNATHSWSEQRPTVRRLLGPAQKLRPLNVWLKKNVRKIRIEVASWFKNLQRL